MSFNPRPGRVTGATSMTTASEAVVLFQSAPRSCDRSDKWVEVKLQGQCLFQSAPRSCDRSDKPDHGSRYQAQSVSIRAPVV